MSSNIPNNAPFLRTSRSFPTEIQALSVELDRSYLDIANSVNSRTIGLYSTNAFVTTGDAWYVNSNQKMQTIRKIYTFTSGGTIAHGINFSNIVGFVQIYGTFTDSLNKSVQNWFPLPYVNVTGANNQINIYLDTTNINIQVGGGAPPPIAYGYVVLEFLSNV
tara:strand:- start:8078 stop:8566 length:489 start_codon:yes stop_codon:yes gene_type:complete